MQTVVSPKQEGNLLQFHLIYLRIRPGSGRFRLIFRAPSIELNCMGGKCTCWGSCDTFLLCSYWHGPCADCIRCWDGTCRVSKRSTNCGQHFAGTKPASNLTRMQLLKPIIRTGLFDRSLFTNLRSANADKCRAGRWNLFCQLFVAIIDSNGYSNYLAH